MPSFLTRKKENYEFDGNSFNIDYKGRPYGNKLNGTLAYEVGDDVGEAEFVATR